MDQEKQSEMAREEGVSGGGEGDSVVEFTAERDICSLAEFATWIAQLRDEVSETLWFRGQADATWDLDPTILRPPWDARMPKEEHQLRRVFELRAPAFADRIPESEFERLGIMQHHGFPTRLLDWTGGALIALYFALRARPTKKETSAAVWILCPSHMNIARAKAVGGKSKGALWMAHNFERTQSEAPHLLRKAPVATLLSHTTDRAQAQRSSFTWHPERRAIEALQEGSDQRFLWKLRIPATNQRELLKEVIGMGITESTVFPDLNALAREIRHSRPDGEDWALDT